MRRFEEVAGAVIRLAITLLITAIVAYVPTIVTLIITDLCGVKVIYGPWLLGGIAVPVAAFRLRRWYRIERIVFSRPHFQEASDATRYRQLPLPPKTHPPRKLLKTRERRPHRFRLWGKAIVVWTLAVVGVVLALLVSVAFVGLGIPLVWLVCKIASRHLDESAEQIGRFQAPTLEELRAADPRPPVLVLRSFLDDMLEVKAPGLLGRKTNGRTGTFEEVLCAYLRSWGPCVAIGDPKDSLPPLGAARAYFTHDTWQEQALRLLSEANAVAIIMGLTPGVEWEIERVLRNGFGGKSFIIMPPARNLEDQVRRFTTLVRALYRVGNVDWSKALASDEHLLVIAFTDAREPVAIVSASVSMRAYLDAVALAMRVQTGNRLGTQPVAN